MKRFALILLLAASSCVSQEHTKDHQASLDQIQSWIPADSSVADVQRIMEQHGFYCQTHDDHVLCSCSYSNTSRWVSLTVQKGQPVNAYEDALTIDSRPPNTALEPTAIGAGSSANADDDSSRRGSASGR